VRRLVTGFVEGRRGAGRRCTRDWHGDSPDVDTEIDRRVRYSSAIAMLARRPALHERAPGS
jgi:hypothetical protein